MPSDGTSKPSFLLEEGESASLSNAEASASPTEKTFNGESSPTSPASENTGTATYTPSAPTSPQSAASEKAGLVARRKLKKLSLNLDLAGSIWGAGQRGESGSSSHCHSPLEGPTDSLADSWRLPQTFRDKYSELGECLGAGTVAQVKLAVRRSDGGKVAVKMIVTEDEEMRNFMRDEYELMVNLRHPNIIRADELHESPTCLMIGMELCAVGSLEHRVKRHGVLPEAKAVQLFHNLLLGINHLHLKRIVHRDLKPENLLLTNGSAPGEHILKIADFNSAKRIGGGPGISIMLSERGTTFYSAPELRFGRIWNERVDIWASGMCFYFMRHCAAPFNILEPGHAAILRSGRRPEMSAAGFSQCASSLLHQCLTVEMRDRPAAMELVLHPLFNEGRPHHQRPRSCEAPRSPGIDSFTKDPSWPSNVNIDASGSIPEEFRSEEPCVYQNASPRPRRMSFDIGTTCSGTACWKEKRNHSDALQRLANMRFERTLKEQKEERSRRPSGEAQALEDALGLLRGDSEHTDCSRRSGDEESAGGDGNSAHRRSGDEESAAGGDSPDGEMSPCRGKRAREDRKRVRGDRARVQSDRFFTTHGASTT